MRDKFLPLSPLFRRSKPFVSPPINKTTIGRKFDPRCVFSRFQNIERHLRQKNLSLDIVGLLLPHHRPLELGMLNRKWLPLFCSGLELKSVIEWPPRRHMRDSEWISPSLPFSLSFDIDIPPHLSRIGLFCPHFSFFLLPTPAPPSPTVGGCAANLLLVAAWRVNTRSARSVGPRSAAVLPERAPTLHSALTCQCCRCQCQRSTLYW